MQNSSRTYWIVLDDPNNHVCGVEGFIPCETVFDETSIIFYGSLKCRTDVVGFAMHMSSHDLGLKVVPVGVVDVEGNGFMSVYVRTPLFPKEVFDNGDELFGDLSLHRNDLGKLAFCFHNVDASHPLSSMLEASVLSASGYLSASAYGNQTQSAPDSKSGS